MNIYGDNILHFFYWFVSFISLLSFRETSWYNLPGGALVYETSVPFLLFEVQRPFEYISDYH